eukprot:12884506-Alexandrium_andersonii.AAC.1
MLRSVTNVGARLACCCRRAREQFSRGEARWAVVGPEVLRSSAALLFLGLGSGVAKIAGRAFV